MAFALLQGWICYSETEGLTEMADFEARDMLLLIREDISKISVLWEELHEDFLQKIATAVERDELREVLYIAGCDARRTELKAGVVGDMLDLMGRMIDEMEVDDASPVKTIHGERGKARSR